MHHMLAHYIDPGTGSMLFTLFIGIVTTAYFFLRQVIIKLKFFAHGGAGKAGATQEKLPYVIFSDSKRYWNVFKPICDEFERRGIDVAYWTASPDDPALSEKYDHVTCEFIGEENKAFARLNMMSATVCLSTTPGLDVYQWKRSKEVDWYVHTLHAVGSAAGYRMFGIDYFDAMLLSGQFQVDEVRELEAKRHLPAKDIELVGCTYLDVMAERLAREGAANTSRTTVLLAPSWGDNAILSVYGERILKALVDTGFDIIVRPHPQSMTSEKAMLDSLMAAYPDSEHFSWNFDNDNFDVLNRADIMISDFSGVVFDYALVFDKPVIYTEGRFDADAYDAAWLDKPLWKFSVYPTLGIPLSEDQFANMREVIVGALMDQRLQAGRDQARADVWAHPGRSAELTVDYLVRMHDHIVANGVPERAVAASEDEAEVEASQETESAVEAPAAPRHARPASLDERIPQVTLDGPLASDTEAEPEAGLVRSVSREAVVVADSVPEEAPNALAVRPNGTDRWSVAGDGYIVINEDYVSHAGAVDEPAPLEVAPKRFRRQGIEVSPETVELLLNKVHSLTGEVESLRGEVDTLRARNQDDTDTKR